MENRRRHVWNWPVNSWNMGTGQSFGVSFRDWKRRFCIGERNTRSLCVSSFQWNASSLYHVIALRWQAVFYLICCSICWSIILPQKNRKFNSISPWQRLYQFVSTRCLVHCFQNGVWLPYCISYVRVTMLWVIFNWCCKLESLSVSSRFIWQLSVSCMLCWSNNNINNHDLVRQELPFLGPPLRDWGNWD